MWFRFHFWRAKTQGWQSTSFIINKTNFSRLAFWRTLFRRKSCSSFRESGLIFLIWPNYCRFDWISVEYRLQINIHYNCFVKTYFYSCFVFGMILLWWGEVLFEWDFWRDSSCMMRRSSFNLFSSFRFCIEYRSKVRVLDFEVKECNNKCLGTQYVNILDRPTPLYIVYRANYARISG